MPCTSTPFWNKHNFYLGHAPTLGTFAMDTPETISPAVLESSGQNKITKQWQWDWGENLRHKQEDFSLKPQYPGENPGMGASACDSSVAGSQPA